MKWLLLAAGLAGFGCTVSLGEVIAPPQTAAVCLAELDSADGGVLCCHRFMCSDVMAVADRPVDRGYPPQVGGATLRDGGLFCWFVECGAR